MNRFSVPSQRRRVLSLSGLSRWVALVVGFGVAASAALAEADPNSLGGGILVTPTPQPRVQAEPTPRLPDGPRLPPPVQPTPVQPTPVQVEPTPILPDQPRFPTTHYDEDHRDDDRYDDWDHRGDRDTRTIIIQRDDRYYDDRYDDDPYRDHRYRTDDYYRSRDDRYGRRYYDADPVVCTLSGGTMAFRRGWLRYPSIELYMRPGRTTEVDLPVYSSEGSNATVIGRLSGDGTNIEVCRQPRGSRREVCVEVEATPRELRRGFSIPVERAEFLRNARLACRTASHRYR